MNFVAVAAVGVACVAWSASVLASPECRASHELLDLDHPLDIAKKGVAVAAKPAAAKPAASAAKPAAPKTVSPKKK